MRYTYEILEITRRKLIAVVIAEDDFDAMLKAQDGEFTATSPADLLPDVERYITRRISAEDV